MKTLELHESYLYAVSDAIHRNLDAMNWTKTELDELRRELILLNLNVVMFIREYAEVEPTGGVRVPQSTDLDALEPVLGFWFVCTAKSLMQSAQRIADDYKRIAPEITAECQALPPSKRITLSAAGDLFGMVPGMVKAIVDMSVVERLRRIATSANSGDGSCSTSQGKQTSDPSSIQLVDSDSTK